MSNVPTRFQVAYTFMIFLVVLFLPGCAEAPPDVDMDKLNASPINANTNFKLLTYDQVANMIESPSAIYLEPVTVDDLKTMGVSSKDASFSVHWLENDEGIDADNSAYNKCQSRRDTEDQCDLFATIFPGWANESDVQRAESHQLPVARQYFETLFIGCADTQNHHGKFVCSQLELAFISIGNIDAARAVLEKGVCTAVEGNFKRDPCWNNYFALDQTTKDIFYPGSAGHQGLIAQLEKKCNDEQDDQVCERLQGMGVSYNNDALSQARARRDAQNQQNILDHSNNSDDGSAPTTAEKDAEYNNATFNALKTYAAEHAVNTDNQNQQPYNRPNNYQALTQSHQRQSAQSNSNYAAEHAVNTNNQNQQSYSRPNNYQAPMQSHQPQSEQVNSNEVLVSPLESCIRQFYDPQTYNWLSFENDCGADISITFIFGTELGGNEMDLRAGRHDSTGRSAQEVEQMGGFKYVICPMGFIPNDYAGHPINRNNKSGSFRCKKIQ